MPRGGGSGGGCDRQPAAAAGTWSDPYGVLNVRADASPSDIQRSYRQLSRTFHPDKHPTGPRMEEARMAFVDFKNAHDILADPVLRQAYDLHGHGGVGFVRRSMNAADGSSLYHRLTRLHGVGRTEEAGDLLDEEVQYQRYRTETSEVDASGAIEVGCSLLGTAFLSGGGEEPPGIPDVERANMSFSAGTVQGADSKWRASFGGSAHVRNGEAGGDPSASVAYEAAQGTEVTMDVDLGERPKATLGTSRVLSERTLVTTNLSTVPGDPGKLAMSLSSHRSLFRNSVRGTWAVGMSAPDLGLHFGLLQFATLNTRPRYAAKITVGMGSHLLKLSANHKFGPGHSGMVSWAWGPSGIELATSSTRAVARYAKFTIGLTHVTARGLTWLLRLKRGDFVLSVPIAVSSALRPGYGFDCAYMSFLSLLIDEAMRDLVSDAATRLFVDDDDNDKGERKDAKAALKREEAQLAEMNRTRSDVRQQIDFMKKPAEEKRIREEKKGGLVILKAIYGADGGNELDVTVQLQFWVANSSLHLPSSSKRNLLGFYDVRGMLPEADVAFSRVSTWRGYLHRFSWGLIQPKQRKTEGRLPKLTVRYKFSGGLYEITILDNESLFLPSPQALKLGDSAYVK